MGRHPFMGTVRKGESPTLPQAIKDVRFVYTENRDVGMDQPPGTPTLSDFPRTVADLFETAFLTNPTQVRPTAAQWVSALEELEKSLIQCADEKLHRYPKDASECPWCAMERELGVTLFIPYIPPTSIHAAAFDPGANGFDLGSVWRRIVSVGYLDRAQVAPQLTSQAISPSDSVRKTVLKRRLFIGGRLLLGGAAIAVAWFAPLAWILWLPVALYAAFGGRVKGSMAADNLLRQFGEVERKWRGALENWYKRIGVDTASDLYQSLNQAMLAYEALGKEETTLRRAYMDQRRARQLHAYLDNFEIRHSRIKGIGPAKEAALTSYGIETAADVVLSKVLTVPGFGPTNSQALMQWRAKLEGRFAYSGNENDIDRQELAKIAANIQAKAAQLRRTLLAGPANLQTLLARAKGLAAVKDPELARIQVARLQILADLEYLGIPKSVIDQRARAQSSTQPAQAAPPTARPQPVPPSQSRVSCPRCGSPMVRRTARRGRNAGNQFWGCSRYPQCKGTRN